MTTRPCILIPTYHNPRTVGDVVRAAREHGPVLVVDDGCTDETPEILREIAAAYGAALALLAGRGERIAPIPADGSPDEVHAQIMAALAPLLEAR